MALDVITSLDYMIEDLRFYLGDVIIPYRYTDNHLRHALVMACKALMKKWRNRYTINTSYIVSRSPTAEFYEFTPPIVERADEVAFILQGSIIIKTAELQDTSWDVASWRDDEVAYSNIAGGSALRRSLDNDIAALAEFLRRRLFGSARQSMTGFKLPLNLREGYR
jgi:hypothetical protein